MTAQIIDFAQKRREKRENEFLTPGDKPVLSPEELKALSLSLRATFPYYIQPETAKDGETLNIAFSEQRQDKCESTNSKNSEMRK